MVALLEQDITGVPGDASNSPLAVAISASSELVVDPEHGEKSTIDVLSADQRGSRRTTTSKRPATAGSLSWRWARVNVLPSRLRSGMSRRLRRGSARDAQASVVSDLGAAGIPCEPVALNEADAFHRSSMHHRLGAIGTLETVGFGRIDVVSGWWAFGPASPEESIPPSASTASRCCKRRAARTMRP